MSPVADKETYIPGDHRVIGAEVFWLGLSVCLIFAYALQRRYFPWTVVLRDLPWSSQLEEEQNCRDSNFCVVMFQSFRKTLYMNEQDLINQCGLDGYLTIRLMRFCLRILTIVCTFNLVFLAPIYRSQKRTLNCESYCQTHNSTSPADAYRADCVCGFVDSLSLANVRTSSNIFWITTLFMFISTLLVLFYLRSEYKDIIRIRHEFWSSKPSKLYSVFVDRIPRKLAPPRAFREYFEQLFPGQIYSIEVVSPIDALSKIGKLRMQTLLLLERAIVVKAREGNNPKNWIWSNSKHCFTKVDSIEYYASELEKLNSQFKLLKDRQIEYKNMVPDEAIRPRHAFITFRCVTPALIASQTLVEENMVLKHAPNPNDVRWDTLGDRNTAFTHFVRKTISRILFAIVVLFWGAITSFIGALTSTEALAQQFSGLNDFLLDHPNFIVWLDRLSTLIYVILIALVYPIIALSVKMEVRIAQSNVERAILERYFLFLVVQVFVFYSIAGSVFKSVVDIAKSPSQLFDTLSATIPKNASFFIGFISVKTFWVYFDLIRGYNFVFAVLRRMFFGATLTDKELKYQYCGCCWDFRYPSPVNLAIRNADVLLVFFIATSYAVIQPLLTLAALIYFFSAYLCYSVILTTSSKQLYDGGGTFWTHTFWCVAASLITAQMTLVGTLLTKQAFSQAFFIFGLSIFTLVLTSHLDDKYRAAATDVTLELATKLDEDGDQGQNIVEIASETFLSYNVVMDFSHIQEPEIHQETSEQKLTKVFRYVHPVLLEQEFVSPQIPEIARGIRELGEGRGSTGGDLGYARMLDLDWNSTGISSPNHNDIREISRVSNGTDTIT